MAQGIKHEPTDENRQIVQQLSALGTRYEDIAIELDISADTLSKYYSKELEKGRIKANAKVAQGLYNQAVNGNTAASMFWLKTRAGWSETSKHEITGANGSPIPISVGIEFVDANTRDKEVSE